ncbi:MAG: alpha/beta fold hydrolase [Acidocella sp.]|nr:alpha/beta fold hydrolase [Acidocella sp.]
MKSGPPTTVVMLPYRARGRFTVFQPAAGKLRAVVLALHGYTDSRDAWVLLAEVLNRQGIALYAPDQSGFGATANRGTWPGTAVLVDEARQMAGQLRAQYPQTKLVLMGESMGGAEAILLGASVNPPPVDAYVISAPAVWGADALNPAYQEALRVAAFLAPQKRLTGGAVHVQASDNKAALIAFGKDPLTIHAPRLDNLAGLVRMMGDAQIACARFEKPALILYGGHDALIPKAAMRRCWQAIPAGAPTGAPVVLAYYPADYHLIERDLERATPSADIAGFILDEGVLSDAPSEATVFLAGGG